MYRGKPEVAAGFTEDDYEQEQIEVWPVNLLIVNTFIQMDTQWRVGFHGRYGLDYNALPNVLRLMAVPEADWPEVFEGIRTMEGAALEVIHTK